MTLARTFTRTYDAIDFADPYKTCDQCGEWITGVLDSPHPINLPCEHRASYTDRCPSWGPVDGCQCVEQLGHKLHEEAPRV